MKGERTLDIQCLYDIMAVICSKICSLDKESESNLYRNYWSNIETNTKKIYERFPFLNPEENPSDSIFDDIDEDQWNDLLMFVKDSKGNDRYLISCLACLDRIVDLDKGMKTYFSCSEYNIYSFSALNSNVDTCGGKLVPKYTPKWKKSRERSVSELGEKALSVLQNYIWIKSSDDNAWEITNFYSHEWEYAGKVPFKIVCSPLMNKEPFDVSKDTEGEIKYFYIKYNDDVKELVANRVELTLDYAAQQEADIALFPEMVAYPELHERIEKYVKNGWDKLYPKIIFLPSSEHNRDGQWKDKTYAINSSGENIFEYCKQHPYQWDIDKRIGSIDSKEKCFEPIQADHKISIIHYNGIGRIGVCICSDLFHNELMDLLLKTYNIDLLLILSYSEGRDRFERSISSAKDAVCDVVWCNSCAAYIDSKQKKTTRKNKNPAVSYFPFGHTNLRKLNRKSKRADDYTLLYRCSNDECDTCSKCMITVEINPSYKG